MVRIRMHALGISPYYLNINAFICIGATAFICPTEHGIIKSHIHTTNYSVSNDLCCLFTIVLCYTAVWYNTNIFVHSRYARSIVQSSTFGLVFGSFDWKNATEFRFHLFSIIFFFLVGELIKKFVIAFPPVFF